jgi:hypothetical protein
MSTEKLALAVGRGDAHLCIGCSPGPGSATGHARLEHRGAIGPGRPDVPGAEPRGLAGRQLDI